MSRIELPPMLRTSEIVRTSLRRLDASRIFVLLLGPSATGKSTVISELNALTNNGFSYVKPTMTRENRPGETDKVSVSDEVFDKQEANGDFVIVNNLYGVRYGTPLRGIMDPLAEATTPILDYPLETVDRLKRPEYDLLKFYVYPPSIESWEDRMNLSGRNKDGRLEAGRQELSQLALAHYMHRNIDISVVNHDGDAAGTAADILESIEQVTQH